MSNKQSIFDLLKQLADAVATTFGPNCEIAIHDLSTLKHSLIYLAGNVTKRKLGAPITDMVVTALIKEGRQVKDRYGYKTIMDDGRELKSSTIFIRDERGEVIAAFCINFDTTDYLNAMRAIDVLAKFNNHNHASPLTETFAFSINDTVDTLFEQAVSEIGKQPATMTTDEKIRLVKVLERKGAFQIKGVVNQVALRLGVSNFTVYNYLKKIRASNSIGNADMIGK
jgi:predicted transcriptional regulator YheO